MDRQNRHGNCVPQILMVPKPGTRLIIGRLGKIWRAKPGKALSRNRDHTSVMTVTRGEHEYTSGFQFDLHQLVYSKVHHLTAGSVRSGHGFCWSWSAGFRTSFVTGQLGQVQAFHRGPGPGLRPEAGGFRSTHCTLAVEMRCPLAMVRMLWPR